MFSLFHFLFSIFFFVLCVFGLFVSLLRHFRLVTLAISSVLLCSTAPVSTTVAVAAAHAVLDVIEKEDLCARAARIGDMMQSRLKDMARRNTFNCIGDVRGLGMMVAFELVKDRETREPDAALTSALIAKAEANGLILLSCGPDANVIRLLAPLTIPEEQVKKGLDIIEQSLAAVVSA